MSEESECASNGRRQPVRIPPALEREMLLAIAEHRRAHGARHYDELRNRPDFAPWIGAALGETGRKRFQRLVEKVSRPMPEDRTKKHRGREANEAQFVWASAQASRANGQAGGALVVTPEQVMAGGGATLTGFHELTEMLRDGPRDIDLVREAAFIDGKLVDPALLLKATRERREWVEAVERLANRFTSNLRTHEFAEKVVRLILDHLADDPVKQSAVLAGLNAIVADMNGLPASSGIAA